MALIHYQKGDIFGSNAQVIVNTVNCEGVMGKGLALAFKRRYPEMFPVYQQECKTGKLPLVDLLYIKKLPRGYLTSQQKIFGDHPQNWST